MDLWHSMHTHRHLEKRGLLTAKSAPTEHKAEVVQLLEAVTGPRETAVIHCRAHQKGIQTYSGEAI